MKKTFILFAIAVFPICIFAQSYAVNLPGYSLDLGITVSTDDGNITNFYFGSIYKGTFEPKTSFDLTGNKQSYECDEQNCKISLSTSKKILTYSYEMPCRSESFGENGEITKASYGDVIIKHIFTSNNGSMTYDNKEIYLMKKQNDGSYIDNCYGQYKIEKSQIVDNIVRFTDEYNRKVSGRITEDESFYLTFTTSDDPSLQTVNIAYKN